MYMETQAIEIDILNIVRNQVNRFYGLTNTLSKYFLT